MFRFATILLIQMLCGMEMDLFIPSFPELQEVFELTPFMVQMTISVNFTAFCLCSLFAGALGDRYNRRHVMLIGLLIFVLGSILCVSATHYVMLLLGRFLQGVGIAAPAILSFPILLDDYSPQKQPGVMSMINGVKTFATAFAPVIGSFVNLYFSWRGNFTLLLSLSALCLVACYFAVPSKAGNNTVSLSPLTYLPLLKSTKVLGYIFSISLIASAYFVFVGMAPILYMEDMGVKLQHFGYYQGVLSLAFALVCVLSPPLLNAFGLKRCLYFGMALCFIGALLILGLVIKEINQPFIITAFGVIFSLGAAFPINILYPRLLQAIPHTQGRSAALGQSIMLLLIAILIQGVSYIYVGHFKPIGLVMSFTILFALIIISLMIKNKSILLVAPSTT
ncbi:MAG: MFS transporter [Candidatus Berkiellales bacterium]